MQAKVILATALTLTAPVRSFSQSPLAQPNFKAISAELAANRQNLDLPLPIRTLLSKPDMTDLEIKSSYEQLVRATSQLKMFDRVEKTLVELSRKLNLEQNHEISWQKTEVHELVMEFARLKYAWRGSANYQKGEVINLTDAANLQAQLLASFEGLATSIEELTPTFPVAKSTEKLRVQHLTALTAIKSAYVAGPDTDFATWSSVWKAKESGVSKASGNFADAHLAANSINEINEAKAISMENAVKNVSSGVKIFAGIVLSAGLLLAWFKYKSSGLTRQPRKRSNLNGAKLTDETIKVASGNWY